MLAEFAIALPLLILLAYGLALVGVKIFWLGKTQLADYALEEEAQYVMERITQQARAANEVHIESGRHLIRFVYHTAVDDPYNTVNSVADVQETQYFILREENNVYTVLNAKRRDDGSLSNPITGGNSFGDTKINSLQYDVDKSRKILHIVLEMQSLVTERKIKLATAVFMPGLEVVTQ